MKHEGRDNSIFHNALYALAFLGADPDIPILKEAKAEYAKLQLLLELEAPSGTEPDRCREIPFPRNIKGAHFAVGFDRLHHHLAKGAPL
jgi:hypothetical protein